LIDQVGKPESQRATPTVSVKEKRAKMRADYVSFRRRFAKKPISIGDVDELLKHILTEIWTEDAVQEVIAA
jgi:hypothetical protein